MYVHNFTYEEFANKIQQENKKIYVYGAGVIGTILAPYIFEAYNLDRYVIAYIDGDSRKQGQFQKLNSKNVPILSINDVNDLENAIILITNSIFVSVIEALEKNEKFKNVECAILPAMQSYKVDRESEGNIVKESQIPLIPKVIHYCWFGKGAIPKALQKCIDSWQYFCPDYDIICWNENNYDVNKNLYMKQAYEQKKYGFVPDIARLEILYEHGGIYLDTDVELIRPLDDLLYQRGFCGVEKWGHINIGGGAGCVKGNSVIKDILEKRKDELFIYPDGSFNKTTCGIYETNPLLEKGYKPNNELQIIDDMTIYPADFFCPFNYMTGKTTITKNTFSIHHFGGSWMEDKIKEERKKTMDLLNHSI